MRRPALHLSTRRSPEHPNHGNVRILLLFALYAATAFIVFIAVRIELLNARAGYYLPNDAVMAENRRHGGSGAWRATWMDEQRWRRWYIRDERGEPATRPLTAAEEDRMNSDIRRANANYRLRSFVAGFGCLQYPLVLFVVFAGVKLARREPRRLMRIALYLLPVTVAAAAGVLAVYRGYVRSLID